MSSSSEEQWECGECGNEFPTEDMVVQECLAGTHYRCPYCHATNLRKVKAA